MNKKQLQEAFRAAEARAKVILDGVGSEEMTPEQRKALDAELREMESLQAQLDELRGGEGARQAELRRRFEAMPANGDPDDPFERSQHRGGGTRPDDERQGPLVRSRKWGELCRRSGQNADDWGGFRDESEYFAALTSGRYDPRLNARASGTLVDADGGFAVPAPMLAMIFDSALESEIVRPRAQIYAMTSRTLSVPAWQNEDHSGGDLYGAFGAQWVAEHGSFDVDTPKLRRVEFEARKLGLLARVSSELSSDSPTFSSALMEAMTKAASFHLDKAFLVGAAPGGPQGVLTSPALVTVAKETNQAAATILYENVVKMWSRLLPGSHANAVWVTSATALPQLLTMSIAIGTAGAFVPAVTQRDGSLFLMGKPLLVSEKLPTLGSAGDLLLADFSQFAIAMRADVRIDASGAPFFTSDEMAVRLKIRLDAKTLLGSAISPANGGDTLSPFVTLAART